MHAYIESHISCAGFFDANCTLQVVISVSRSEKMFMMVKSMIIERNLKNWREKESGSS